jgi:hypothetical protein
MDEAGVLWLLVVVTVLNTAAIGVLAVSTIRSRPVAASTVAPAIPRSTTPVARSFGSTSPDAAAVRPVAADPPPSGDDPLAGAISAFLSRPDGLFRTGGPPPERGSAAVAPAPVGPSSSTTLSRSARSPAPPVRYVASGPRPAARPVPMPRAAAPTAGPPTTTAPPIAPARASLPASSPVALPASTPITMPEPVAPRRDGVLVAPPESRVSIWFVGRDPSRSTVEPAAVQRLGPVIGGLLRERTRTEDRVAVEGGRRFVVTLPDTPIDGAAALTRRLARSCDAWLAAEEPPLRLEFGMTELPGTPGRPARSLDRGAGPERRRTVPSDV